jgi:hypothetical protein
VEAQERALREHAEHRGLLLTSIYADAGLSGFTMERPSLQQLIADCRAGKVGTIITRDADRLSRDLGQLIALLHIFATADVRVDYSADEGRGSFCDLGFTGDFVGRSLRNDPELGLGEREGSLKVEPLLDPVLVVEHGAKRFGAPQVLEQNGIEDTGRHVSVSPMLEKMHSMPDNDAAASGRNVRGRAREAT